MGNCHQDHSLYLKLTFIKHLHCASHCPHHFTYINSFNPQKTYEVGTVFPFYSRGNWGTARLIQLGNGKARAWTRQCSHSIPHCPAHTVITVPQGPSLAGVTTDIQSWSPFSMKPEHWLSRRYMKTFSKPRFFSWHLPRDTLMSLAPHSSLRSRRERSEIGREGGIGTL